MAAHGHAEPLANPDAGEREGLHMRVRAGLLAVLALFVLPTGVAAVGKPEREPLVYPPSLVLPAGFACEEFDVQVDFLVNREFTKTFFDAEGNPIRSLVTGSLVVQLTNVEDDISMVFNIGGPSHTIYNSEGTVTQYFLGRSAPLFEGLFYLSFGRHVFLLDENLGLIEAGATSGRSVDVCALLTAS